MQKKSQNKIELLAPAGDMEKLKTALHFGADAVYFAGKNYGLRAYGTNFDEFSIKEAMDIIHSAGKKGYVTLNVYARHNDFDGLYDYVKSLVDAKVDAVLISDLGIFSFVHQNFPNLPIHISTQANTTNSEAAKMWHKLGAERVVLARELTIEEIKNITKENPELEIEAFVHGAMCISYSGRCLLSNYLTGRDSNHGECVQACRWKYSVIEENRPDDKLDLTEDTRGTYIFNSKDLRLIEYLDKIYEAGVFSFKIEGRMKSPYYVATVVNAYRRAIDYMLSCEKEKKKYEVPKDLLGKILVEQRNKFKIGDTLEILSPNNLFRKTLKIDNMEDEKGNTIQEAKVVQQKIWIKTDLPFEVGDILRM